LANTDTIRQKAPGRARAIGLGVAIAAHVVVFAALVLTVTVPHLIEPPAIQVSLVPAFPVETRALARPKSAPPPPRTEREVAPRPGRLVGPEKVTPLPIPAAPPDAATRERLMAAPLAPSREPVREGLRTTGGCADADFLKLAPSEREKCRQRNHDLGIGAPTYAVGPSDPKKRAFLDKQAAKNEAHRLRMEAPPSPPMAGCGGDSRFANLGFSCNQADGSAHLKF
jgi:hypothetical protein